MFNLLPINNNQLVETLDNLKETATVLLFPYTELKRVVPDSLNEYIVEECPGKQPVCESGWDGVFYTVKLRNSYIPTNNLLVSGIICVSTKQNSSGFWFDLSDHSITEIQCFTYLSKSQLAIVLLEQKGNGKTELLKVLSASI